jgi:threonine dehydrogenase-like Zn-dependent dehydrogenase
MDAVVTRQLGSCSLEDLDLRAPAARDVVVRIDASGICHSDVSVMTGDLLVRLPVVLGHEGAGVVTDVGSEVTTVRVGDRVVLSPSRRAASAISALAASPTSVPTVRRFVGRASSTARRRSTVPPAWGRSPTAW